MNAHARNQKSLATYNEAQGAAVKLANEARVIQAQLNEIQQAQSEELMKHYGHKIKHYREIYGRLREKLNITAGEGPDAKWLTAPGTLSITGITSTTLQFQYSYRPYSGLRAAEAPTITKFELPLTFFQKSTWEFTKMVRNEVKQSRINAQLKELNAAKAALRKIQKENVAAHEKLEQEQERLQALNARLYPEKEKV